MRKPCIHPIALSVILLLGATRLMSQNEVIVVPVVSPPFSPYLYTYQDQMLVTLTNTTDQQQRVKLIGFIEGDNGYSARTNSTYLPPQPIVLGAFESNTIPASSPSINFLDQGNITINAPQSVQNTIAQTGQLPEGNYTLCVRAVDYDSGEPLSEETPSGCIFFTITDAQPPLITWPYCGDSITTPWPTFTWSPPIGMLAGADIRYDFYLIELLPGQNAVEAMGQAIDYHANSPIVRPGLMVPSYAWQPYDPALDVGVWYAVAVVAKDLNNAVVIQNRGRSEVCLFILRDEQGPGTTTVTSAAEVLPSNVATLPIPNARISGKLLYTYKSTEMIDLPAMGGIASIAQQAMGGLFSGAEGASTWAVGAPAAPAGGAVNAMPWGTMVDNYSVGPIANILPAFPTEKWLDPFPVSSSGAKPLKNVQVRLVERVVLEQVTITQNGNTLASQDRVVLGLTEPEAMSGNPLLNELAHRGRVLAVFTTGADGGFSVDYHQLNPTAFQAVNVTVAEPYIHHFSENYQPVWSNIPTVQAGLAYRVLMLEVVPPYYCSPDLMVLAQPGDDLHLPDQTVYVRTYDLKVRTRSNNSSHQTMQDQPLPNVIVKATRRTSAQQPGIPEDEGQDLGTPITLPYADYFGTAKLIAEGITNAQGEAVLRRLVQDAPGIIDSYLLWARTDSTGGSLHYNDVLKTYYEGVPKDAPPAPLVDHDWDEDAQAFVMKPLLNSRFTVKTYTTTMPPMQPGWPRVIGRVMASINEVIPGAKVRLELKFNKPPGQNQPVTCYNCPPGMDPPPDLLNLIAYTDAQGFFHFDDIPMLLTAMAGAPSDFLGPEARLIVTKPGFEPAQRPQQGRQQLLGGFQWDHTGGIFLKPYGLISGTVVDENGQPLKSDVKGGDGPTGRTTTVIVPAGSSSGSGAGIGRVMFGTAERFEVQCPSGTSVPILVEPLSDKYFSALHLMPVGAQNGGTQDLGALMVKEKLHRIMVRVQDEGDQPIAGAEVWIGDLKMVTPGTGRVQFKFASKASDFRLKVNASAPWVPVDQLINNDVSRDFVELVVKMERGAKLAGRVIEKGTTAFVPHARVWVELGSDQYGPIRHETIADEIGEFVLDGVPVKPITVHAAKHEDGVTWIGDEHAIAPVPPPANQQSGAWTFPYTKMELQRVAGMDISTLLGFNVELEDYQPQQDGTTLIGGAFVQLPANANFTTVNAAERVPFSAVKVKPGAPNANGVPRAELVGPNVITDATHVALKLHGGHDMTLEGPPSILGIGRVHVDPEPDGGAVRGMVNTELSTFKFTYDFDGRFFLGEGPDQPMITTFRSNGQLAKRNYHLMDMGYPSTGNGWVIAIPEPKDIAFDLRGFPAHADRVKSYVTTDTFSLRTLLRVTEIPSMLPDELTIDVGDVKVLNEEIVGLQGGGSQLSFKLGTWELKGTAPWSFNKDLGCITVPTAKLVTHRATADVKELLLWPNDIDLDATQLGEVRIGDAVPLKMSDSSPWQFGYSQAEQAWVLGKASNSNASLVHFTGVPKLVPDRVDLSAFRLLSNGQEKVTVIESDHVYDGIVDFRVNGLDPGTNNVQLLGRPYLHMPNFPNASARVMVERQGSQLLSSMGAINALVPTRGKVDFTFLTGATDQSVTSGKFTTLGHLRVWDEQKQSHIPLIGKLTHTKTVTTIEVIKTNGGQAPGDLEQTIALSGDKMMVRKGEQKATPAAWEELWFDANLSGFKDLQETQEPLHFVAKGAVTVGDGKITTDKMSTPFGGLSLSYDFKHGWLDGSLTTQVPIPIAPLINLKQATLAMRAGGGGFYLAAHDAKADVTNIPFSELDFSFIVGAHKAVDGQLLQQLLAKLYHKQLPPQLAGNKVNGFFFTGHKTLMDFSLPGLDLVVVDVEGHVKSGADLRFGLDLEQLETRLSMLTYFDIYFGIDVTACEFSLQGVAMITTDPVAISPAGAETSGCGSLTVKGCGCGYEDSMSIALGAKAGTNGFSAWLASGCANALPSLKSCD